MDIPTTTMRLHPAVVAHLDAGARAGLPPYESLSPAQARSQFAAVSAARRGPDHEPLPMAEIGEHGVASGGRMVPLRTYRPPADEARPSLPTVVFLHGGGWVIGDLDTHDALCRRIATELPSVVVAVDYALAPEHPFPAPVEDAWAATRWAAAHLSDLGGDLGTLVVAGDSAGAAMAAVVARRARDTGGPSIAAQMLLYPVADLSMSTPSYREMGTGKGLTASTMAWFLGHYGGAADDPDASPMAADDLRGLPPALVTTAAHDPLRDEGDAYAARLRAAGVAVTHRRHLDLIHAYALLETVLPAVEAISGDIAALGELLSP